MKKKTQTLLFTLYQKPVYLMQINCYFLFIGDIIPHNLRKLKRNKHPRHSENKFPFQREKTVVPTILRNKCNKRWKRHCYFLSVVCDIRAGLPIQLTHFNKLSYMITIECCWFIRVFWLERVYNLHWFIREIFMKTLNYYFW